MNLNKVLCQKTGRVLKADNMFKIVDENSLESIVTICASCKYAFCKNKLDAECNNCYGIIVQNAKRIINKETGMPNTIIENYRNTFTREDEEIIRNMGADEYLDSLNIVANLNSNNWNHGQRVDDKLRAYDKSKTWKTDCIECKSKCSKSGELTACQRASEFLNKNGFDSELPLDCICRSQTQEMFFV